jgi:hypothetical protein
MVFDVSTSGDHDVTLVLMLHGFGVLHGVGHSAGQQPCDPAILGEMGDRRGVRNVSIELR